MRATCVCLVATQQLQQQEKNKIEQQTSGSDFWLYNIFWAHVKIYSHPWSQVVANQYFHVVFAELLDYLLFHSKKPRSKYSIYVLSMCVI